MNLYNSKYILILYGLFDKNFGKIVFLFAIFLSIDSNQNTINQNTKFRNFKSNCTR